MYTHAGAHIHIGTQKRGGDAAGKGRAEKDHGMLLSSHQRCCFPGGKSAAGYSETLGCDGWVSGSGVQGLVSLLAIPVSSQTTSVESCNLKVPCPAHLENGPSVLGLGLILILHRGVNNLALTR